MHAGIVPLIGQAVSDGWFDRLLDDLTGRTAVGSVAIVVGAAVIWLILARLGHRAARRIATRRAESAAPEKEAEIRQRIMTVWVLVRRILLIVVSVVVLLTLLAWWNIPIGPFLAVGGVVGVAVGFGAQDLIKSIIAGLFIVSENQYSIGDVVRIGQATGTVEDIRLRITVLRDLEGNVYYVPNGSIDITANLTQEFASVVIDVGVAYGEDVDRVIAVLGDELGAFHGDEEWNTVMLEEPVILGVNNLGDFAVDVRVQLKVFADLRWQVKRELLRRIKKRLDAEGIEIPFPYRTLVPGDPAGWQAALGGGATAG